jgi:hypothetical protein
MVYYGEAYSNMYCKTCPLAIVCISKSDFNAITVSTDQPLYNEKIEAEFIVQLRLFKI